MDTNITTASDLIGAGSPFGTPIGLPGEAAAPPAGSSPLDAPSLQEPLSARPRKRRKALLVTAAIGTILLGAAGAAGLYYRQDLRTFDLHRLQVPAFLTQVPGFSAPPASEVGVQPGAASTIQAQRPSAAPAQANSAARPQIAEFASLQSLPGSPTGEVGVGVPNPASAAVVAPQGVATSPEMPAPASQAVAPLASSAIAAGSLAATQASEQGTSAALAPNPFQAVSIVQPPAAGPAPASTLTATAPKVLADSPALAPTSPTAKPLPVAEQTPAHITAPVAPPTSAAPPVATSPAPRDAIQAAAALQAAPLSPPEQVRLIDMLKEYGAQLRDTRSEVAQLKDAVVKLQAEVEAKTTAFETRLGLAEVGTVLAQSARAGHPEPSTTAATLPPLRVAAVGRAGPPASTAAAPAVSATRTVRDYRIQGASPGLAVLAVLNPLPGGQGVIEVAVGSEVPGVGRIKSIAQRGTAWVVQTDAGAIQ